MEWENDITGLPLADIVATLGDAALIKIQASSNIVALAPFIPKTADVTDPGNFLAAYTPIAMLGWCLFHQDDAVAANDVPISNFVLSPPAIEAALVLLKDNEFPVREYASLGEFTKQVLDHKTKHILQGLALRPAALQALEACTGDKLPESKPHEFIAALKIYQLCNPDSLSYAPVALFELSAAPRILLESRFASASSGIRMAKAVTALLVRHDAVLNARVSAKEKLTDMQDELKELYAEFFSRSSFPISAISLPAEKYDSRDSRRVEYFASMCTWQFDSAKQQDVISKYFINLVKAEPYLAKIVLPAPTAAAAAHNVAMLLPTAAPKASLPISVSVLSIMNAGIVQRNLHAPIDIDEMKSELGEAKTLLVIGKTDVIGNASSSAISISASGAKEAHISAETQAWLLSREAQDIEARFKNAINHKDVFSAIMVLTRSRNGLFMQLLINRNGIGASELWKRAKAIRGQLLPAFSFAVTSKRRGGSDPATENDLVQPEKLDTFTAEVSFFDLFWGKDGTSVRGKWSKIQPHKVIFSIKSLQRGSKAVAMFNIAEDKRWGDFTQNTFVSSYLDAAFHFSGYKNGVFSQFIEPANALLSENSNLASRRFAVLQKQITAAVHLGLDEAGIPYNACFVTNSHVETFPEEGLRLLPEDSKYSRRLLRIQRKIDNLSDDEFWDDDNLVDELRLQMEKGQQRMKGMLFVSLMYLMTCVPCIWLHAIVSNTKRDASMHHCSLF